MDRVIPSRDRWQARLGRHGKPLLLTAVLAAFAVWTAGALRPGVALDEMRVGTARLGDIEAVVTALGVVEPAAERVMTSPVDARLLRVLERPGSRVDRGQAILSLDISATELEFDKLISRLAQARARHTERRLELLKEKSDLRSRLQIAELELEEARFQLEQSRQLADEGLISTSSLRATETRKKRLEIELGGLEESVRNAEESATAQLAGLGAEIRSLEQEVAQLESVLERATARAERAGVLTWVLEEEGAEVRRGDALARLADLASFRVEATVSDVHAQRLEAGQPVRVPLGGEELAGRVSRVLPAVEEGTLRFIVELKRPGHASLRPNLRLDVEVITATRRGVLLIERGQGTAAGRSRELYVLDADGSRAHRRRVELGLAGARTVEVVSGLAEGERVILSDLSRFEGAGELRLR